VSWKANISWNSGLRDGSRLSPRCLISSRNGNSWWSWAPITTAIACWATVAMVAASATRNRNGRALTSMPNNASEWGSRRLARAEPTTTSSSPVCWRTSTAKAVRNNANRVMPCSAQIVSRRASVASSTVARSISPVKV
jgi:hypothetical protein